MAPKPAAAIPVEIWGCCRSLVPYFTFILLLCAITSLNQLRYGALHSRCAFMINSGSSMDHIIHLPSGSILSSQHAAARQASSYNLPPSLLASGQSLISHENRLRILIGILTLADQYQRRSFLRLVYRTQQVPANVQIDIKFVFCNLTKEEQRIWVALEIMLYDDIIILNCTENMDLGKTYTYFSSLWELFKDEDDQHSESSSSRRPYPPYHYVMKGDDDTYFRLEKLAESLKPLPREDLYYGFVIPCESKDPFKHYMSGMGFAVSWDIVEWVRDSDIPRRHHVGPEDMVFGEWLKMGRKGRNRHNAKWSMYNFPEPPTHCSHELWQETIAVHLLKKEPRWIKTLKYFNVTRNLKPSKLYHIP
ncbi:hypothetical protein SAY87_017434 [Trapa incisa]|uniref:Hexosyltransferase n=1 Tax=Trapa incisa TaxID=236973 RepID=A0AAN7LE45_9MYRT|nr:hypothetical protein SAY87_017434 [Trapa incisa]